MFQEAVKGIQFIVSKGEALPNMELDRDQMKRALINIIDNAIAAMDGHGKIMISTRYNSTLQFVVIEVADHGPGIPEELRSHLFEPYFSTKQGGTGLGLAIVRKIVTDHQGYIRVSPNHPRGTKFVIELPITENQPRVGSKGQTDARPHLNR